MRVVTAAHLPEHPARGGIPAVCRQGARALRINRFPRARTAPRRELLPALLIRSMTFARPDVPPRTAGWPVAKLLASQRQWGTAKCGTFLAHNRISEVKPVRELTERQRRLLAVQLT